MRYAIAIVVLFYSVMPSASAATDGAAFTVHREAHVDGARVTVTETLRDTDGNIAHKREYVRDADGNGSLQETLYGADEAPITFFDLSAPDGPFVEIVNMQYGARRHVIPNSQAKVWHVRRGDGAQYDLGVDEGGLFVRSDGAIAHAFLPLQVDDATGALVAVATSGAVQNIAVLPHEIFMQTRTGGIVRDTDPDVALVADASRIVYEVRRMMHRKFLGVLPLRIADRWTYDPATGREITRPHHTILQRIVARLSF